MITPEVEKSSLMITPEVEKSRRFSKLPPAPKDSPNAVQMGSKFTMIPRDQMKQS